jgi:NAD-dependent SIR2 family protein deacetylase
MFDACGGDEEVWMAHGNPIAYHYCSECKNETYLNEEGEEILSDYCPFCGADMREEGADNG